MVLEYFVGGSIITDVINVKNSIVCGCFNLMDAIHCESMHRYHLESGLYEREFFYIH